MARERRLPSARSSVAGSNKQAKGVAETHDDNEKPAVEKDETSHAAASSAGDEVNKHDEPKQSSSSELEDTRTFQQLVHDYGDDMLSLNELFHAQPSNNDVEANKGKAEMEDGK